MYLPANYSDSARTIGSLAKAKSSNFASIYFLSSKGKKDIMDKGKEK